MEVQYRENNDDAMCTWGPWKPLGVGMSVTFWATHPDYALQIRKKPEFEPGYYRRRGIAHNNPALYMNNAAELEILSVEYGALPEDFDRVTVVLDVE